jgi:hypothetical protein
MRAAPREPCSATLAPSPLPPSDPMSQEPASSTAVVAEGDFQHLREIQSKLRERGVHSEIVRPPPEQCSS